jgi:hypothetical protein
MATKPKMTPKQFEKMDRAADKKAGVKEGSARDKMMDATRAKKMGMKMPASMK